ncbi:winged helix DNA-binding protein [Psychromarinibacter sp. C21-152]|uniref:Winged helix DNA-binding protein n=1 Tax=Psychromarinibacter sediminicola TaxID=3033385 RepID=A0AAE3NV86_9RHOB|nr:MarR family transcriptional regulator [Psychromarinibacter sediminicola]MDF0602742.1 winged helix DNA-binding protein [Psychromarinibacter sediminicola]
MSYRLHESLGYRLTLASRVQQRRLEEKLRPLGLSRLDWVILVSVGYDGLRRPSDISDHLGVDRTAVSRALRRMETSGLLARRNGKGDGRTRTVALTDAGRDTLARATPLAQENAALIAERLSPGEQDLLARLLTKLITDDDLPPSTF